jgi:hypothetical protein
MDGWRRMGLDDAFQIRQVLLGLALGFPPGLVGVGVSIVDTMDIYPLNHSQIINFYLPAFASWLEYYILITG